jgi:hypothetical protein
VSPSSERLFRRAFACSPEIFGVSTRRLRALLAFPLAALGEHGRGRSRGGERERPGDSRNADARQGAIFWPCRSLAEQCICRRARGELFHANACDTRINGACHDGVFIHATCDFAAAAAACAADVLHARGISQRAHRSISRAPTSATVAHGGLPRGPLQCGPSRPLAYAPSRPIRWTARRAGGGPAAACPCASPSPRPMPCLAASGRQCHCGTPRAWPIRSGRGGLSRALAHACSRFIHGATI